MKKLLIPALLAASFSAHADLLDFTNNATSLSGSIAGTTYTVTGNPNRNQAFDSASCFGSLACQNDGIGILNDEISVSQTLTLTFGKAVTITGMSFFDLYNQKNEIASYSFDGGAATEVTGSSRGYVALTGLNQNVTSISFTAPNVNKLNDFALSSISVSPVPEASTSLMFGTGMALMGLMGLRRKAKKTA